MPDRGRRSKLRTMRSARCVLRRTVLAPFDIVADRALAEKLGAELQRAEHVPELVADRAIETIQPHRLVGDRVGVFGDERRGGDLHQHADGAIEPPADLEALDRRDAARIGARFVRDELLERFAEQVVLTQHLMDRRLLAMTQLSELARLVDNHRLGRDVLVGRRGHVLPDLLDQRRDVIEQEIAREDRVWIDRENCDQPFEPARGEMVMRSLEAFADRERVCRRERQGVAERQQRIRTNVFAHGGWFVEYTPTVWRWLCAGPGPAQRIATIKSVASSSKPFTANVFTSDMSAAWRSAAPSAR
jgi:hypothetical protein